MKVGFFDSGVGGITLLSYARDNVAGEDYVFYADEDNVPYGVKTAEEIRKLTHAAVSCLVDRGCKAVVIACNTATSAAIEYLRKEFEGMPVIGIEPAVKPAVTHTGHRRVLVMATPLTVREAKLKQLIDRFDHEGQVDLLPMPELVAFAESEEFTGGRVRDYIARSLSPFKLEEYSDLVLGCTHFNYFKDTMASLLPVSTEIIDGSAGTVNHLVRILESRGLAGGGSGKVEYLVSGRPAEHGSDFAGRAERMMSRAREMRKITRGTL